MNILRVCRTFPTNENTGAGMHCFKYSILSKYKSTIITKEDIKKILPTQKELELHQIKYRDLIIKTSKIRLFYLPFIVVSKIWGELVCFIKILEIVKKNKFDFIHIHSINYLISGYFIKQLFKIPIGLNIGGTDFYRAKKFSIYKFILKRVDKIFYVSNEMKNDLLEIVDQSVLVHTANGFNDEIFYHTGNQRDDIILTVGNLRWQKNHALLINAFKRFLQFYPKYKLHIVGSGPEEQKLKDLVIKLGIKDSIVFNGQLPQKDIAKKMNKSKIFCLSSKSEGFPKVILEAFACGLPVISTDVGECKNVIEKGGIISNEDIEDYANHLISYIKNDNFSEYTKEALNISRNYSWRKVVDIVDNTYDIFN